MKRILLCALLLVSCSKSGTPNIQISNSWARETVAGQTATAAYLVIANRGSENDRLVSIAAPAPATAMLHSSGNSGGVARMREIESGMAIPSGGSIELKPGGSHIMVTGLGAPLQPGHSLKLTLHFERSGDRPVDVPIMPATGPGSN